jgi:hypothetical protein
MGNLIIVYSLSALAVLGPIFLGYFLDKKAGRKLWAGWHAELSHAAEKIGEIISLVFGLAVLVFVGGVIFGGIAILSIIPMSIILVGIFLVLVCILFVLIS